MTLDAVTTATFDGLVFGERQPNRWMNGSSGFSRTQDFDPGFEETKLGVPIHLAITYKLLDGGQMLVTGYRNGEPIGQYQTGSAAQWNPGDAEVHFGHRWGHVGGGPGGLDALIEEARLYRKALTAAEIMKLYSLPLRPSATRVGDKLRIVWTDPAAQLESADVITGPWTSVAGAASPFEQDLSTAVKRFFRLVKQP
jgi:hypothetical protein